MGAAIIRMAAVVVLVGGAYLLLRFFEWSQLYHPVRTLRATPADASLGFDEVRFVAEDGVGLHGWWIPCDDARGAVIYCHGNGENIGNLVEAARFLHQHRLDVFLFDYRGYGKSRGFASEQGTYRDARAAYEYVRARYEDAERPPVVVLGRSLGGAVASQLALDKPVRGVVVECTFASAVAMGKRLFPRLPVAACCHYRYDSISKVGRRRMPLLVAHSRADEVVPFEQARELFERAAPPKEFVALRGGHNEAGWDNTPAYREALEAFLDRVLGS